MSLFNLVVTWLGLRSSNNIDVEILFKSNDFIIVNKPEDVFTNNHNKAVSKIKQNILLKLNFKFLIYILFICGVGGLKSVRNTSIV